MKGCELCGKAARMFCESDQAFLCWDCDNDVHSANFLVAKHCRTLLCTTCQSPTPWKASGSNLGPTVSVCDSCFSSHCSNENIGEEQEHESQYEEESAEENDDEEEVEEEDGENQVVPWSSEPSGERSDAEVSSGFLKRGRENSADHDSDGEVGCSSSFSSEKGYGRNEEGASSSSHNNNNLLKRSKRNESDEEEEDDHGKKGCKLSSSAASIIDSLNRIQRERVRNEESASSTIFGICKLSRDQIL